MERERGKSRTDMPARARGVPGSGFGLTDLVILYQQNGQPDEAKQTAERFLSARPDFTITSWLKTQTIRDPARLETDVNALRSAGLPMS